MRDWISEKDISAIGYIEDERDAEVASDVRVPRSCVMSR